MPMICLSDFEDYAKKHLPKSTWDFFAAGADECCTRDDNLLAYKRIHFRPRMLRGMSVIDTRTMLLGTEISFPVGIAPTSFHRLAWPDGEKSTARAAEAMNTCYITSTFSTCTMEEIAAAAPNGFRWFQLYIHRNRALSEGLVRRVEAAGFQGLVLTADLPYTGKRRDDIRNNFQLPPHMTVKNFEGVFEEESSEYGLPSNSIDPSINWNDIYWLQSLTRLPIIVKGILTKEDADLAVRHGVKGIIVSNHGGRQLDGGPATIDALIEIVDTVQDRAEVYLDGGIRTGSDVLKALALGAKCVFLGRPALWGLTYKGEEGLREVLQILHDEFRLSMALAGPVAVVKSGNVKWHSETKHMDFDHKYPLGSHLSSDKIASLKDEYFSDRNMISKATCAQEKATEASLRCLWVMAKHRKPFTDAVIIKQGVVTAETLFAEKKDVVDAFRQLPLSDTTAMRCTEMMAQDVFKQLGEKQNRKIFRGNGQVL